MVKLSAWLRLARPKQWSKNLLVLAALVFAVRFRELGDLITGAVAFASFTFLSASVYALNDLMDVEADRKHPLKRKRPVASGEVGKSEAMALAGLWAGMGLGLAFWLGGGFLTCAVAYLALSTTYSSWTKHQVILDVLSLAAGFVLRAAAGGLALHVRISEWLLVCTTLLAIFLGLTKRRAELAALGSGKPTAQRRSLAHYSLPLLDQMISVAASLTLVAYLFYVVLAPHAGGAWMLLTAPFVLYGIFRYLYLSHQKGLGSAPEQVLFGDRPLQVTIVLWVLTSAVILAHPF